MYQQLADITFLIFKPFDFILKGVFIAAGLLVCWGNINDPQSNSESAFQDACRHCQVLVQIRHGSNLYDVCGVVLFYL